MACHLCLLGLGGCQPLVVDLGVEPARALFDATDASRGTDTQGATGPAQASPPADASDSVEGGVPEPQVEGGIAEPQQCWSLVDPALAVLQSQVSLMTLEQLSCEPSDAGEALTSNVYSSNDGSLLMRAGHRYSARWTSGSIQKLQWSGGEAPCDTHAIYTELSEPTAIGIGSLPDPPCRVFTSPIDVKFLRVPADDAPILGTIELCPGECPDG